MDANIIVILFGMFIFSFSKFGIEGRRVVTEGRLRYSTAKTIHGDIYDCVDRTSQPGFKEAALLKTLQRFNNQSVNVTSKHKGFDLDKIWEGKRCPTGTVPIPRKTGNINPIPIPTLNQSLAYQGGTEFAGIVVNQPGLTGAYAQIALWNPQPVNPGQFSAASILIENGLDVIEAGWIVHPDLYGDTRTRLYTAWRSARGGSYNTDNPGFILFSDEIPLNYVFPRTSNKAKERDQFSLMIQVGDVAGNWYLTVNDIDLGYWRAAVVPNLSKSGTTIRFGGQVYNHPPVQQDSPPMGSGTYAGDNPTKTNYMQHVTVLLNEFKPPPSYQKVESRCYFTGSDGYHGLNGIDAFHFLFGGTGGHDRTTCYY
ncbi:OLC1v1016713C1 [Oldenlandia corymbosa var. corymbosa]|uniref:OLC1v1016713C1 n=1 Tax=Oldenlandia corymbosa var. corymbosa TaxID=529605 RepID=A0AAV1E7R9_OLDCO|nr:OLC1v1016713C1 [Oldenlandia corymbosa var. corymbosa]